MEDKRKPIMIAIIVGSIGLAIAITIMTRSGGEVGIEVIDPGEMVWIRCSNCGAVYQISKRDHAKFVLENRDPETAVIPGMTCKECGEESAYRVEKCDKCGHVFELGSVPDDFTDKCPKCGYSREEERRKAARNR